MARMIGFECEFVEQPPKYLQSECPICLLVLRDPYQVTCCGKSFCKACIQEIKGRNQRCPTCKEKRFKRFPNLGLKQPLYGFRVYCCNKAKGCDWQGELGQLDQHLNLDPDEDKQFIGCAFAEIQCLYCMFSTVLERCMLERHQLSECLARPFTCVMCEAYESTYYDVTNHHVSVCEYRPVECPNSCGDDNLQHQHLEGHLSSQCPLSLVECEFSHAGCDVEVCRKDLPSHLSDSMVTHMSLLARENRNLKLQVEENKLQLNKQAELLLKKQAEDSELLLKKQAEENKLQLKKQVAYKQKLFLRLLNSIPPLDILVSMDSSIESHVIYSRRGYKLEADLWCNSDMFGYSFFTLESEFDVLSQDKLSITALLVDQAKNKNHLELRHDVYYPQAVYPYSFHKRIGRSIHKRRSNSITCSYNKVHLKDGSLILRITDIK